MDASGEVLEELIKAKENIKRKYTVLKQGKADIQSIVTVTFRPIINPLNEIQKSTLDKTIDNTEDLHFYQIDELLDSYSIDKTYGPKLQPNKTVRLAPKLYTENDLKTYKSILIQTSAHLTSNSKQIKKGGNKYRDIITTLFPSGSGLSVQLQKHTLQYWNDPNELVSPSKAAGNTGVSNEILSIFEELREAGYTKHCFTKFAWVIALKSKTAKEVSNAIEREENAAGPSNPSPHKKRSSKFDFRTLCLVCGEEANEDVEKRKRQEYRRKIKQVSTLSFKDNIIKTAESRGDRLGKIVRDRVNFEYDLVAAEAKYHDNCLISFNKYKSGGSVGRPHDENIRLAMEEIFYYIENNNDCQFTLTELVNAITSDFFPDAKTIIYKLTARYGKDIIITTKHAKLTIICFLDTQKKILCESWYENKKSNVSEERLRVVEAAAAIIKEDIRSVLINTDTYPPVNQMFDNINKNIPQSNINELENKCTALSHAIMKCTRPRSFLSRLLLGISVFLHRRYGSKRLLDMLSNLGFSNTYKEVLLYESAVVNHPQPKILSPAAGAFIHAVIVDEEIPRLKIIPAAKDIAAIAHVPLQMYDNFGVSELSKIDVENILSDNVSIKSFINKIDFLWMYGKWKTVSDVPGWNGFIEYLTKENNKFSTSRILFLPFIHHPASNLNTIYTTLNSIHDNMKFHGHEACVVTFDQPLFIKAREIVAAS
ncbi:hypothetical protein AGLY_016612 [Aphis glycines]|uniref:DUF8207 domain-containing protein n=1 Tax=Aphis glycines TaxID=307491 RepID=A0A6G0SZ69_APHGL|nr:hypothetical protein AGLY_016612 [Aphis glycines]